MVACWALAFHLQTCSFYLLHLSRLLRGSYGFHLQYVRAGAGAPKLSQVSLQQAHHCRRGRKMGWKLAGMLTER